MKVDYIHSLIARVYYEDTDASGVVYHAAYLKFAERARTEIIRSLGIDQQNLRQQEGCVFVVTQLKIKYKEASFLDDLILVETRVVSVNAFKLTLSQILKVGDRVKADMTVDVVMVDHKKWQLVRLPALLQNKFKEILHD